MIDSIPPSEAAPPPLPKENAGWWAWPVVILSVFFIGWSVNLFSPKFPESEEEKKPREVSPTDLAMLKIQSQVVIAAATVSPAEAGETISQLREMGGGDRGLASIALLESFTKVPDVDSVKTAEDISDEASQEMRQLVKKAVNEGIDESERETLKEHLGWFAELARAPGLEPPPNSTEIKTRAMVFFVIVFFVFLAAVVAILFGAGAIFVMHRRNREQGGICRFRPGASPRGVMLECFAIYLGVMAFGEVAGVAALRFGGVWQKLAEIPFFPVMIFVASVVVPFLWPMFRGIRFCDFLRCLGMHRGKGIFKEVGAGMIGYAGVAAFAFVGIIITLGLTFVVGWVDTTFLSPETIPGRESAVGAKEPPSGPMTHPIVGWIYEGGMVERLLCLLLASGFAPLFEELFFRGALHRYLRGKHRFLFSAILTGVIFASLHPQGWMAIPALTAIGVGFSMLREWRDSLIAPMVAHAINNGVLVGMLCLAL